MIYHYITKYYFILLLYSLSIIWPNHLNAQQKAPTKKFYAGAETGAGFLQYSSNTNEGERTARFSLGFYGGYIPFRTLRLGINLNGYLIEPFDYSSPEKGKSISNTQVQIQIMPFKNNNLFANFQGGWSTYTNHHPYESNSKGTAGKIGLGYEFNLGKRLFGSLILNYATGKFKDVNYLGILTTDQHYDTFEILTCITFR